ncbi:MAG TPA: glycosyltransferase family 10 [Tepidisphaeraceae bacterium]|nr:glycosyltransferase family 10 [Tepidisphaeraceae bacterium]
MTLVRIIKAWSFPDLARQTAGGSWTWEGVRFTVDPVEDSDYAVVLTYPKEPTVVRCSQGNCWLLLQEPPTEGFRAYHQGSRIYDRIFTQDESLWGTQYMHSQPALPWHVNKDYEFLKRCGVPEKSRPLSWITSNAKFLRGHRARMQLVERLQGKMEFDLFGKGIRYIEDKWDGLAPYRYAVAVENFCGPYYWTEKIADALLSWTMPIYYGCTNIESYFPKEAMVRIDLHDPDVVEKIRDVVAGDRWKQNLDAIAEARRLILDRYQLFPFLADQIRGRESREGAANGQRCKELTVRRERYLWRRLKEKGLGALGFGR